MNENEQRLRAALLSETDPEKRRQLKTFAIGVQYKSGAGQLVENLTQISAAGMLADLQAKVEASGGVLVLADPHISKPETFDFAALEKRVMEKSRQQSNRSMANMLRLAFRAGLPSHLGGRYEPQPKAVYETCQGCGNPTKSGAFCFKCQKAKS